MSLMNIKNVKINFQNDFSPDFSPLYYCIKYLRDIDKIKIMIEKESLNDDQK
jgi:hypothetical protein